MTNRVSHRNASCQRYCSTVSLIGCCLELRKTEGEEYDGHRQLFGGIWIMPMTLLCYPGLIDSQVGLNTSPQKTKVLPVNISAPLPIKEGQLEFETTQQFTYLGSTGSNDGWWGGGGGGRLTSTSDRGLVML